MNETELLRAFAEEFKELCASERRVELELTPLEAWALMSNLQLALRHPNNVGPTARTAKGVAERLQGIVAPDGVLAEVARRGWNVRYDV